MHGDANDLREWFNRRRALQEVFVPISDAPMGGSRGGDARQRQRRRQHMLSKAGMRVLGIERIDEQRGPRTDRTRTKMRVQLRRDSKLSRDIQSVQASLPLRGIQLIKRIAGAAGYL